MEYHKKMGDLGDKHISNLQHDLLYLMKLQLRPNKLSFMELNFIQTRKGLHGGSPIDGFQMSIKRPSSGGQTRDR